MLSIFTPVKIQRLRQGLNPQTWVPEASMLTTRPSKPSLFVIRETFSATEREQIAKHCARRSTTRILFLEFLAVVR